MRGFVVGKEINSYVPKEEKGKENPVEKVSRTLYVVWDKPRRSVDGMSGNKVEAIWVPFEIHDVEVGAYCDFEYEARQIGNRSYASLVDIQVLGKAQIALVPPKI